MKSIVFIDTEIQESSGTIVDLGAVNSEGHFFHKNNLNLFLKFISNAEYICGHNIFKHDLKYIGKAILDAHIDSANIIDTLCLSPLLFPKKPYHALNKDYKLQAEESNSPLNDSIITKSRLDDQIAAFQNIDGVLKQIFYLLLKDKREFQSFFQYLEYSCNETNIETLIRHKFQTEICEYAYLTKLISENPIELAYCLSLINVNSRYSITPHWALKNYPEIERIMFQLRNKPCISGCEYCNKTLDIHYALKRFFGHDSFRTYSEEPLQEKAVKAAVSNKSILAVFPTGGGKSITFQVPALMSGESVKGLTVVISPLQSLMKDQVDNLEKNGITEAVTINGLLDPIERAKSFERVEDGSASILYISPESLRSKTIERLLLGRNVVRFVVDEAHCFSSWGQDFRVDYLYIGDFIKLLQEKKNLEDGIPVSCFTATAKPKVIEDIRDYFKQKLSLDLEVFSSKASRTNLHYKVFEKGNEEEKYQIARDLIEEKKCPTIIYVSRTRRAYLLAERLTKNGFNAKPYHGKMDVKEKTANQEDFINGEVPIMVATSAFGMGVDKKDIGMVIHFDISDSLENYIQEAGRAGRDENITADCFVLFNEEDLGKHFILLNQTKLSIKEIQQIWKAIKDITKFRSTVSNSALEIARKAGWDDNVAEIETRVKTAISALEDAKYLKRGQNISRVFADSILSKNAQEAIDKINASEKFEANLKEKSIRIIKKLFSSKSKNQSNDEKGEARIDYISDHLGIVKEEVIKIIYLLREEKILANTKDLTAFIKKDEHINRSLKIVEAFGKIENFLLSIFEEQEKTFHIKEIIEEAEENGSQDVTPSKIKTLINFWAIKNWIKRQNSYYSKNHVVVGCLQSKILLKEKLEKRHYLSKFIIEFLYSKSNVNISLGDKAEVLVEFSVHELKDLFENSIASFGKKVSIEEVEDALFYLSRIDAIKIEGGFLVVYNSLTIERVEQDKNKKYTLDDYKKLDQFYENKVQQIHIVGEYAKKMIEDYKDALQFVEDYFKLNYTLFLNKYFKGNRQNEIKQNLTPAKFKQLFGDLSPIQLKIIKDNVSPYIVVAAGPGSGKTRVLVHKLASLLFTEDVKHEQLLMLTFSRAAATEFKQRLIKLIGNAANFIEIKTFHSYCFDLLGRVGSIEKSDEILKKTIEKIKNKEVEQIRITKTVLVIDEAQDMNEDEFKLINTLMVQNEEMRVIAVGDDDQNIYEFRRASSKYLEQFIEDKKAVIHELIENYRSKSNLVDFSNQFVQKIQHRMKNIPIIAKQADNGKLKLVHYHSGNLTSPMVNDILKTGLTGTTCVLTKTNEEALEITRLLLKQGMQAKLIQTNDGFSLYNLLEVRFFLCQLNLADDVSIFSDDVWADAKQGLVKKFSSSSKLEIANNIINKFEATNPKMKYTSDLESFIRESKLEEFYSENGETIIDSTIHKVKGKEFDNVFLMLENFNLETDADKRLLYVAFTRAKRNLTIHLNTSILDNIIVENMEHIEDKAIYLPPKMIAFNLTFKDVYLDYFINRQKYIDDLLSGDILKIEGNECKNQNGDTVLKFSQNFIMEIKSQETKGYFPKEARINFILFWKKEDSEKEVKIILPEVYFERLPK